MVPWSIQRNSSLGSAVPSSLSESASFNPLASTLAWLAANQHTDGSYGDYFETYTAAAAYALWLNDSNSAKAASAYTYLSRQLDDSSAWFWPTNGGEADYPGTVLYSVATSQHLDSLSNPRDVFSRLLQFQQPNGGFRGYSLPPAYTSVTSSVDTALALLGLTNANGISVENRTSATNYLLSLQNPDGSFNLTSTVRADSIYSTGPDALSITALVLLALRDASFNINQAQISTALQFLNQASSTGFGGQGHVYAASLSILVFTSFYRPREVSKAVAYILNYQHSDGGFGDATRSGAGTVSNALDTGWAAIALQIGLAGEAGPGPTDRPPVARFSIHPEAPIVGATVQFDASSSYDPDGDPLSYQWTFGDGATATGTTATHTYSRDGAFTVTLTVVETANLPSLQDTARQNLTVQSKAQVPARPVAFPLLIEILLGVVGLAFAILVVAYLVLRGKSRKE